MAVEPVTVSQYRDRRASRGRAWLMAFLLFGALVVAGVALYDMTHRRGYDPDETATAGF